MSNMKFTVKAGDDTHEIEGEPITVLCHPGGIKVDVLDEDVRRIDPQDTQRMADKLADAPDFWLELRSDPVFLRLWKCVWDETELPADLADAPQDMRHIAGLIVCTLWALAHKRRPFWVLPETYLHPRQQTGLADMLVLFTNHTTEESNDQPAA